MFQVTLNNKSDAITSFKFPTNVAQYKMTPSYGVLQPLQSLSVVISFEPNQIGVFKNIVQLIILNGLSSVDIKLIGEAKLDINTKKNGTKINGGTTKIDSNYTKTFKFVDPVNILNEKLENIKIKMMNVDKETMSLSSLERDRMYGMNR